MNYYAGIGSRQTPLEICSEFSFIATLLESKGYTLRSGGAGGADSAFEAGVINPRNKQIFRPRHATPQAKEIAASVHGAWNMCDDYAQSLHGRNAQIVLGLELDAPASFVLSWTLSPDRGGTQVGMKIAKKYQIPVYNFAMPEEAQIIRDWIKGLRGQ